MQQIKVAIVDDNAEIREHLAQFLAEERSVRVIGQAENGLEAINLIRDEKPDLVLLDIIMPGMDGFGVLQHIQLMPKEGRPHVIVITALGRDDFIRRAIALGVSYYMVKPIDIHVLLDRIRDVIRHSEVPAAPLPILPLPGQSMDEKLSNIFLSVGIPAHIKGYQFLREAVKLVVNDHNMIGAITKELYPTIAHHFATTPSKVERAIRHAIEVAWNRGRVDTLNKTFGCTVALPTEKPTNGEFIALLADKLSVDLPA
ncbi:MAG: sporulation transcription factor Spo0A [Clostridia bacterium]|nr:sporulation transcription factor Spo0A [Clostridia bacterium]